MAQDVFGRELAAMVAKWHDFEDQYQPARGAELIKLVRARFTELRRASYPDLRTWGPDDSQPDPPPAGVYDIDGDRWSYDPRLRRWRLGSERHLPDDEGGTDYVTPRSWPDLLLDYGPVTERPATDPTRTS
jgi:hypothetical protein